MHCPEPLKKSNAERQGYSGYFPSDAKLIFLCATLMHSGNKEGSGFRIFIFEYDLDTDPPLYPLARRA